MLGILPSTGMFCYEYFSKFYISQRTNMVVLENKWFEIKMIIRKLSNLKLKRKCKKNLKPQRPKANQKGKKVHFPYPLESKRHPNGHAESASPKYRYPKLTVLFNNDTGIQCYQTLYYHYYMEGFLFVEKDHETSSAIGNTQPKKQGHPDGNFPII